MGILKKLKGNKPEDMTPEERSKAVGLAISEILKKYNCGLDVRQKHEIVFVPLKEENDARKSGETS